MRGHLRQAAIALFLPASACAHAAMTGGGSSPSDNPTFQRAVQLEATSETSANVSIGDVNGDGAPDLMLAKGRHWPLADLVPIGDGRGGFTPGATMPGPADRSYSGILTDLDRDGDLDVVISNDTPDPKRTWLNDGKGHFTAGSEFGEPKWSTRNATVADVNGDSWSDIIVANRTDSGAANYVCLNRGRGRFDERCNAFAHYSATTITMADFNGDGRVDAVVPHRDRGQSYVYINAGGGYSDDARVPFGPSDARIRMAEVADMDGDRVADIVTIDEGHGVVIYPGIKSGGVRFGPGLTVASAEPVPYALKLADLNGDRRPDIIVGHVEAASTIFFNGGRGAAYVAAAFGDRLGAVYGFAVGDLNGDGVPDIAAARSDAPNMLYFGARR